MGAFVQGLIDQGKAEGKAEGLLEVLQHRFGQLPEGVRHRIRAASATDLDKQFRAALDARALADIFGEDSKE